MRKLLGTGIAVALLLILGACGGAQTPYYVVRVVPPLEGQESCLSINNYETNGNNTSTAPDPSQGEMDRSGIYCRIIMKESNPYENYPKEAK